MVCWLFKVDKEIAYLQQNVLLFTNNGKHLLFLIELACFSTFLYSILLLTNTSLKFLLRLKVITGSFRKTSLNDLSTDKMFQCLRTTLFIFWRDWAYVNTGGTFFFFRWYIISFFKTSFVSFFYTTVICLFISSGL